jgi:hypothetical protein
MVQRQVMKGISLAVFPGVGGAAGVMRYRPMGEKGHQGCGITGSGSVRSRVSGCAANRRMMTNERSSPGSNRDQPLAEETDRSQRGRIVSCEPSETLF